MMWRGTRRGVSGWAAILLLSIVSLAACAKDEPPIKIGYVGGLTGRVASLGVAGRDGVLLAVEEVNRAGGVNGRPVEVLARDDRQDPEAARQAVAELVQADVVAIVGPMTSAMAVAIEPLAGQAHLPLVSPTVTANRFSGQDDYFFRLTPALEVNAGKLARHAAGQGVRTIAVALETANADYTEDWLLSFQRVCEAEGSRVVAVERFNSGAEGGFLPLAGRLLKGRPDALLLLTGAMDAAMIAQQVRKLGSQVPLFASEWANTSDVVNFGGKAVEGMRSFVTYDPTTQTPRHQLFVTSFENRFGYKPSFAGLLAYEATGYLLAALQNNPRREGLKAALLAVGRFPGLQGDIRVDRFGDAQRETYLAVIREGRFATVD